LANDGLGLGDGGLGGGGLFAGEGGIGFGLFDQADGVFFGENAPFDQAVDEVDGDVL